MTKQTYPVVALSAENQQTVEAALDVLRAACEARFPEDHPWQMALDEIRAALRDLVAQAADMREMLEQPQRHDFGLDGLHNESLCSVCALLARLDGAR